MAQATLIIHSADGQDSTAQFEVTDDDEPVVITIFSNRIEITSTTEPTIVTE